MLYVFHTSASQPLRTPGFIHTESIGACLNPLGMLIDSRVLYRIPLSQDTGILFRTSRFESGIINEWSPGDEMFGAGINIEPLAIFNLWVKAGAYENYNWFGFGYRPLAGKNGPYHDTVLSEISQKNSAALRLSIAPSLKLKIASVIVADNFTLNRIDFLHEEGYYYEIRTALPHAVHDFDCVNDVIVLYEIKNGFMTGMNHNLVYVNGTGIRQQKLGAIVIKSSSSRIFTDLFALVTGGMYLESGLRKNSPYIAALCGFEMPFSPGKKPAIRRKTE